MLLWQLSFSFTGILFTIYISFYFCFYFSFLLFDGMEWNGREKMDGQTYESSSAQYRNHPPSDNPTYGAHLQIRQQLRTENSEDADKELRERGESWMRLFSLLGIMLDKMNLFRHTHCGDLKWTTLAEGSNSASFDLTRTSWGLHLDGFKWPLRISGQN